MTTSPPSVETQLALINLKLDTLIEQRTDHESRLRALERFRWLVVGAAVVAGGLAGEIARYV